MLNSVRGRKLLAAHTRGNLHLLQHFHFSHCDRWAGRATSPPSVCVTIYLYWLPSCSTFSMTINFRVSTRGCALGHFKAYIFPLVFSWIALQNTVNLPFASEQILFWNLSPHRHGSLLPSVSGCQASQHLWCIILFFSSGQAHMLVTDSKHIVWHHSTCPPNLLCDKTCFRCTATALMSH